MRHAIALAGLCALAGAAAAQPISNTDTYEIFALVGNTTGTQTQLTAFLDDVPDGATFDGQQENAGVNLGFQAGTVQYIVDESLVFNGGNSWTASITMFATSAADPNTLVSFVPGDRTTPALTTLFINFGVAAFGGTGDSISVPTMVSLDGIFVTLFNTSGDAIDFNGANNTDPADDIYQLLAFSLPGAGATSLFSQIGIRALDGNIRGDNLAGFTFSYDFTVVPTPASLALMGMGGLAMARRRR